MVGGGVGGLTLGGGHLARLSLLGRKRKEEKGEIGGNRKGRGNREEEEGKGGGGN